LALSAQRKFGLGGISPMMFANWTMEKDYIDGSPFQSVAIPAVGGYAASGETIEINWSDSEDARPTPVVYLNRIVGTDAIPLFAEINYMDLWDEAGALSDLYRIWRAAVVIAVERGNNTIIIDAEMYNNMDLFYPVTDIAEAMNLPLQTITDRLEAIGRRLVDIVNECTSLPIIIWALDSGLLAYGGIAGTPILPAYLFRGILEQIKDSGSSVCLVCGGNVSFTYCKQNLAAVDTAIANRLAAFQSLAPTYPALRLGAVIVPWHDAALRSGFWLLGNCGTCEFQDLDDFVPAIQALLQAFDFVWIYGAGDFYQPMDAENRTMYNEAIRQALA
jgi:hypothetical protein